MSPTEAEPADAEPANTEPADTEPTDTETWVALLHRPVEPIGLAVFADERFAGHVAFLQELRRRGWLVAAGPLTDEPGAGLSVVRLTGEDALTRVRSFATDGDDSISQGLFTVQVMAWDVRMTGGSAG